METFPVEPFVEEATSSPADTPAESSPVADAAPEPIAEVPDSNTPEAVLAEASRVLCELIRKYDVRAISIGTGTGALPVMEEVKTYDLVLSTACGVGVNFLSDRIGELPVYPGINTSFYGGVPKAGVFTELCAGCGNCILHLTGGTNGARRP